MAAKEKRKLKDLNLLDKFMFDEAMEDEENNEKSSKTKPVISGNDRQPFVTAGVH